MTFAVSAVLMSIIGGVFAREAADSEIVLLPLWNSENVTEMPLSFTVFGQPVDLTLKRNDKIVSPRFRIWKHSVEGTVEELPELKEPLPCHYLHANDVSSAAVSLCEEHGVSGLIFLENVTLEITPLRDESAIFFDGMYLDKRSTGEEPHIVKRAHTPSAYSNYLKTKSKMKKYSDFNNSPLINKLFDQVRQYKNDALTLELAVFFDEPGYTLFSPFFERDDEQIRDMLLAYVNAIQALYHHPSLGARLDISLVRLEIMERQPRDLPHFDGERGNLLDSFCNYAKDRNPRDDGDPDHWDMGLYVSGLDFYAMESGRKNGATMGLATVGGLCIDQYACVIAELGVTNQYGKPYPSAGFTSVYIAAHEIGHNLGMHHDSTGNSCPKDGYIMSPSRGTQGETIWSDCSRKIAEELPRTKPCLLDAPNREITSRLDHTRFLNLPGRQWTAKRQCEFLLRDKDANVVTLYKACEALQCSTPHRSGYYFAGPALDGTFCGSGRECRGGECQNALQFPGSDKPFLEKGEWTSWKLGPCSSGCLLDSKGAKARRRFCKNPAARDTNAGCEGLHYDVVLCKDEHLCKKKRRSVKEFAALKCAEFGEKVPELDGGGGGLQAVHEPQRPWMACAIFCRRKDIASYYTPRVELNDLGLDPYFPDGTRCHTEGGQDYFCRQHHCVPEDFRFAKKLPKYRGDGDVELGPQNARPGGHLLGDQLVKYLSLGVDGLPFLTSLPRDIEPPDEDEWIDKDYIELPDSLVQNDPEDLEMNNIIW